jgi:hypothetical protein
MSANVSSIECIESGEKGWRMSVECIESGESSWRMAGECIESGQNGENGHFGEYSNLPNWQIFGEYSNSTNLPASGHCLNKISTFGSKYGKVIIVRLKSSESTLTK